MKRVEFALGLEVGGREVSNFAWVALAHVGGPDEDVGAARAGPAVRGPARQFVSLPGFDAPFARLVRSDTVAFRFFKLGVPLGALTVCVDEFGHGLLRRRVEGDRGCELEQFEGFPCLAERLWASAGGLRSMGSRNDRRLVTAVPVGTHGEGGTAPAIPETWPNAATCPRKPWPSSASPSPPSRRLPWP
jgi:hypothetical protein